MAMGCDVDGDIRLDFVEDGETVNQREYHLIQVCLFGQWSYVCNWEFAIIKMLIAVLSCSNFCAKVEVELDVPVLMF